MSRRAVLALVLFVVTLVIAVLLVQYVRGMAGEADPPPMPDSTEGPAQGGALEKGFSLETEAAGDIERLPPRDMPPTIESYPPPESLRHTPPATQPDR